MARLWYVIKEGDRLGPYDAAEVRSHLREGRIDAYDLVYQEGSAVKRALVEVDEIFESSQVIFGEAEEADNVPTPDEMYGEATDASIHLTAPGEDRAVRGEGGALDEGRRYLERQRRARRRRKRRSYEIVGRKGEVLATPVTSSQIVKLFAAGQLRGRLFVRRRGDDRTVPVKAFVKACLRNQHGGGSQRARPQQRPSPPRQHNRPKKTVRAVGEWEPIVKIGELTGIRRLRKIKFRRSFDWGLPYLSLIAFGICLILAGAALRGLFEHGPKDWWPKIDWDKMLQFTDVENRRIYNQRKPIQYYPPPRESKPTYQPPRQKRPSVAKPERRRPQFRAPPPTRPKTVRPTVQKKPRPAKRPPPVARTYRAPPKASRAPPRKRPSYKRPTSNLVQRVSQLGPYDGKLVTMGPMQFRKSALDRCQMKCEIVFTDRAGGRLVVVFFKAAYFQKFMASSGTTTIKGNVKRRGGQWVMFLSD